MKYCISKMAVFSLVVHFSFIFCCAVEFFLYLYMCLCDLRACILIGMLSKVRLLTENVISRFNSLLL